jgi:hypothetical protein
MTRSRAAAPLLAIILPALLLSAPRARAQMPAVQTPTQPRVAPGQLPPGWTALGPPQQAVPSAPAPSGAFAPALDTPAPPIRSEQLPVLQPSANPPAAQPNAAPQPPGQTPVQTQAQPTTPTQTTIDWQPRGTAEIQALDKVSTRTTVLTGKVGETLHFGSLSIVVRSCMGRAPDQPMDSAAYFDITDSHPDAPTFHGWMLASEPGASMLEHPVYDIRLAACR